MEIIKKIEEVYGLKIGNSNYEGFQVTTTKRTINCLIGEEEECCEIYGYMASDDNLSNFIGAELYNVYEINEINEKSLATIKKYDDDLLNREEKGGIRFIEFTTNKGVFQLAVYNIHNGYYGHEVIVLSDNNIL